MDGQIYRTALRKVDGEYIVKAYDENGKRLPNSDYFTNDKQDAIDTAALMIKPIRFHEQLV